MGILDHHICCEFWLDQYPHECTCGETAKRAPWFDKVEQDHAAYLAANKSSSEEGNATGLIVAR